MLVQNLWQIWLEKAFRSNKVLTYSKNIDFSSVLRVLSGINFLLREIL